MVAETVELNPMHAKEFLRDVRSVEHQIQDCSRSIRLEHMGAGTKEEREAERRRAEKAAQKALEEAAEREARKKQAMARDPHKKIQLRLENKRRFEMDTLDKAGIPMRALDFNGGKGREQISLVDVRNLQQKCMGLGEPGGVAHMMDMTFHRDEAERMKKTAPFSLSLPELGRASIFDEAWDERLPGIQTQKHEIFVDSLRRRLDQMRQSKPARFPHGHFTEAPRKAKGRAANEVDHREFRTSIDVLDEMVVEDVAKVDAVAASAEVKLGASRHWRQIRGVVQYLKVYFRHMRQLNSHALLVGVLVQLSEWARIKGAISHLMRSVKTLQRSCREFLALRDRRCAVMIKDWQRIEDAHLQAYFHEYGASAMEEHRKEVEGKKLAGLSAAAKKEKGMSWQKAMSGNAQPHLSRVESDNLVDRVMDWRMYRIPVQYRRLAVIRHYMFHLMRHIRTHESFRKTVFRLIDYQKDMVTFLNSFGVENVKVDLDDFKVKDAEQERAAQVQKPSFWHFPDDAILDAIQTSAIALRRTGNFKEHPANKADVLRQAWFDKFCRVPQRLHPDLRQAILAEVGGRAMAQGRRRTFRRRPTDLSKAMADVKGGSASDARRESAGKGKEAKQPPADLDELWNSFTPRLKETAAGQSAKLATGTEGASSTISPSFPDLQAGREGRLA